MGWLGCVSILDQHLHGLHLPFRKTCWCIWCKKIGSDIDLGLSISSNALSSARNRNHAALTDHVTTAVLWSETIMKETCFYSIRGKWIWKTACYMFSISNITNFCSYPETTIILSVWHWRGDEQVVHRSSCCSDRKRKIFPVQQLTWQLK